MKYSLSTVNIFENTAGSVDAVRDNVTGNVTLSLMATDPTCSVYHRETFTRPEFLNILAKLTEVAG